MNITIIDGQGGHLGAQLVKEIVSRFPQAELTAIGTNAIATAAMLKAGAHNGATGENPAVVACRKADVIIGPIGIVIADSLLGEVTEKMALAVSRAVLIFSGGLGLIFKRSSLYLRQLPWGDTAPL